MASKRPRILILGAHGGLGRALARQLAADFDLLPWTRADLDLTDENAVTTRLDATPFDILLNPAGMTSPDVCEEQSATAFQVNVTAPQRIAEACQRRGARLIHFSTDYVFDGTAQQSWGEDDPADPVNVYGRTKLLGERAVLAACPAAVVARVSWLFGPDKPSHPDQIIAKALQSADISAVADKTSSPTFTHDVCAWIDKLLRHHPEVRGTLHLCNSGTTSWHGWAQAALEIAAARGLPVRTTTVTPSQLSSLTFFKAKRPPHTTMLTRRLTQATGISPRPWREALEDYLTQKTSAAG